MEHHPKHIMVTCIFLATKIEEFNVTMKQFVDNIKGDRVKASEIVLNNELLLLHRLNYELTISHPYRPVEGFLIDIKVFLLYIYILSLGDPQMTSFHCRRDIRGATTQSDFESTLTLFLTSPS